MTSVAAGFFMREYLLLISVGSAVAGVLLWAKFIRKPGALQSRRRHRSRPESQTTAPADESVSRNAPDQRRRHRRRFKRRLNPTLAEGRGLPPLRSAANSMPET